MLIHACAHQFVVDMIFVCLEYMCFVKESYQGNAYDVIRWDYQQRVGQHH